MNSGTDEDEFIRILNMRSFPQLKETFEEYDRLDSDGIEKAIKEEFSGTMLKGLLGIGKQAKEIDPRVCV